MNRSFTLLISMHVECNNENRGLRPASFSVSYLLHFHLSPAPSHFSSAPPQVVGEYSYVLEEEEDQEDVLERLTGLMGCRHEHQETNGWVVTALSKIIARLGRFPDSVLNHIATYLVNPNPDIQQVSGWVLVCLCCKGVCGYLMGQVCKCIVPFLLLSHWPLLSLSLAPHLPLIRPSSPSHQSLSSTLLSLSSALPLPLIGPFPPSYRPFPSLSPALPLPLIGPSPPSHPPFPSLSSALSLPLTDPSPPSHQPFPSLSSALPLPLIHPSPPSHRPFPSLSSALPLPLIAPSPPSHPPFPSLSSTLPLPLIAPSPPSHLPFPSLSSTLPLPLICPSPPSHCSFPFPSLALPLPLIRPSPPSHCPFPSLSSALPLPLIRPSPPSHCPFPFPSLAPLLLSHPLLPSPFSPLYSALHRVV